MKEISEILSIEKVDIAFFHEVDELQTYVKTIKLNDYETVTCKTRNGETKTRTTGFVKMNLEYKVRGDLMTVTIPSIWIEVIRKVQKNALCCGLYREWGCDEEKSIRDQLIRLKSIEEQPTMAGNENKPTALLGDINLCMHEWSNKSYRLK